MVESFQAKDFIVLVNSWPLFMEVCTVNYMFIVQILLACSYLDLAILLRRSLTAMKLLTSL